MGPPLDRGGRVVLVDHVDAVRSCFNGATARSRWKGHTASRPSPSGVSLQWGHRSIAVEGQAASTFTRRTDKLQWGHRSIAVEGRTSDRAGRAHARFNGATARSRWKAADPQLGGQGRYGRAHARFNGATARSRWKVRTGACFGCCPVGFNGATARSRWKVNTSSIEYPTAQSFNGATARSRWKGRRDCPAQAPQTVLQWGHRSIAVEGPIDGMEKPPPSSASMGPPLDRGGRTTQRA